MRDDAYLNKEDAAAVDDTAAQNISELWKIAASLQELSGYLASLTKQPLDQGVTYRDLPQSAMREL